MKSNPFQEAKRVIKEESQALDTLANNIPELFDDAIMLIIGSHGRLVVSGIGKSGHIGRKISSTMASLGQRSFFMHPSEAQHGDLGMLQDDDILLLISYSGESIELIPVIEYSKRHGIKIISITKNEESTLAKNSDIPLILPDIKEACPLGMAPTVSSTVTLALGDAMAIAILCEKGFTKDQFKQFHPGGALGKKLSLVSDEMHKDFPIIDENKKMKEALAVMTKFGFGCVGIINQHGELSGIITDGDIRRKMANNFLDINAKNVMTVNPITINQQMPTSEAMHIMEEKNISNLFIVDNFRKPIGIINMLDIIKNKII
ncbi:MAG: KpsF/GutQ family sugar-phosphate isomerase [Alphaproteobacteria bacterium]|nr:KpsF/GutQ family sugar-phosphate isomerase [Alphaproteobacteria bacterium]